MRVTYSKKKLRSKWRKSTSVLYNRRSDDEVFRVWTRTWDISRADAMQWETTTPLSTITACNICRTWRHQGSTFVSDNGLTAADGISEFLKHIITAFLQVSRHCAIFYSILQGPSVSLNCIPLLINSVSPSFCLGSYLGGIRIVYCTSLKCSQLLTF